MNRPARRSYTRQSAPLLKSVPGKSHSLIISEKPDAARKIAAALAEGPVGRVMDGSVEVLSFQRGGADYIVCSALGHLYGLSDSFETRETYPVFDLEWFPSYLTNGKSVGVRRRLRVIGELARHADRLVNACDYDVEGETIGENIIRYACQGREADALRAKFSTLTDPELVSAFEEAKAGTSLGLGRAGRTRHVLDYLWGINLSRVLSESFNSAYPGYKTISMGRVQGPTLGFVVRREIEIRSFVPAPYWLVSGTFQKDGQKFEAPSLHGRFPVKSSAESVRLACDGKDGRVTAAAKVVYKERPPTPFDTSDLQREAFRVFGFAPGKTLQLAQRLYLDASISYPRTGSQRFPPTIGYREIISRLGRMQEYAGLTPKLLEREVVPRQGQKSDNAHPAIYPTGEPLRRSRGSQEARLFDLIVRRFLSCFAEDAVRERTDVSIDVGGHLFGMTGRSTLRSGWLAFYGKYSHLESLPIPVLESGDSLHVAGISCEEKVEAGPQRYDQGSLLGAMEREGIGTKSTRAETISTLLARGYISGERLSASDLGIALVEELEERCPQIVSTELTSEIERELERVETGELEANDVIERALVLLSKQVESLKENAVAAGATFRTAATDEDTRRSVLGVCPICKDGKLVVIRSRKTRKRFVGCTNYSRGCRASAPLPQRGSVTPLAKPCSTCGWPVVYVRTWRKPWRICVNMGCETNKKSVRHAV